MKLCIQSAKKGEGKVSPNPLVGCVVLDKDNNVISKGYHKKYGEYHAERNALIKIEKGVGHTLIVNLEPCSHYGKTPPCTDIIIEKGIKRVVVGMRDVNPKVSGIEILKKSGIEVIENVMNKECKKLNEIFIKNITENKPFIAIKTATTLDGKIAAANGSSKWITSEKAREKVKKIRNKYDAILTTSSTVIADNPTMLHSKKIILDRELKTDLSSNIYKSGEILVFHDKKLNTKNLDNIRFIKTPVNQDKLDMEFIFETAYSLGIKSILIESGGILNAEAIKYADKIYHFIAPKITCDNSSLSCFNGKKIIDISECKEFEIDKITSYKPDILIEYYPK